MTTLTDADYERYAVDANDWVTGYVFPPEGVERLIAERVAEALAPVEALASQWPDGMLSVYHVREAVEQGKAGQA